MSDKERWVELNIRGVRLIVPKEVGIKLFDAIVDGDNIYRREHDWSSKQEWVEPFRSEDINISIMPTERLAIMKLIGANKMQEQLEKDYAKAV
jgi:hypothetical protein